MAIQDYGSNYQFYDKQINPNVKRSSFKLDYLNNMTCSQGLLIPYRLIHTLPNSEYNLELESLLRAINVPKVLLQSRQRVFFHEYHVSYQQLWPSWSTFMSKGVSGTSVLKLPKILFCFSGYFVSYVLRFGLVDGIQHTTDTLVQSDSPSFRNRILNCFGLGFGSLSDYLGFPTPPTFLSKLDEIITNLKTDITHYISDPSSGYASVSFPAFPFFAYFSIYRNFYLNWNLNVNDKLLFPDNINDFALINADIPDSNTFFSSVICGTCYNNYINSSFDNIDSTIFSSVAQLNFGLIKNRNFVDDYFTSALPWPMRGKIPELSLDGQASFSSVPVDLVVSGKNLGPAYVQGYSSQDEYFSSIGNSVNRPILNSIVESLEATVTGTATGADTQYPVTGIASYNAHTSKIGGIQTASLPSSFVSGNPARASLVVNGDTNLSFASGFTWEMIRNLSVSTLIAEKMARTNGSYKEFIRTFFDDVPSNQINNVPRYIGGHVQPIVYTEVLQQSSDSNTPLGTVGAKGITASDGYIGKCYSNDFGLIIGILSIMPDTYYSQGMRRQDLYEVQEDFYLPERAELGMQGIYKGELYFSGNPLIDLDLFGYQNRYDEYRYRPNEVHGELANPNSLSFFPFTQSRYFSDSPVLSNEFVSTKNNVRRDYLTAIDEVDFVAQIACRCIAVQPMPYKAVPMGLK